MSKIIFISIDGARHDAIYGRLVETPHIDMIKRDGVVFSQAFSQSSHTIPSIASIFTSLYLSDLRDIDNIYKKITHPYFLPKQINRSGWKSIAFCGTDFISARVKDNFDKIGRKNIFVLLAKKLSLRILLLINRLWIFKYKYMRKFIVFLIRKLWRIEAFNAKKLSDMAIKEICLTKKSENLFIWLHYFDSHMPYYAPKEIISYYLKNKKEYFREKHKNISDFLPKKDVQSGDINSKDELIYFMAAYFAALTYIDQEIGRLIKVLKERGEYNDCMIVITADHGENLDENGVLCGHNKLFDETTKVPLIIKFPGNLFKSQTCSCLVETADIYPTVLGQFDITPPEKIRGMNLVPYITGEIKTGKRFTITEHIRNFQRSIRDDKWQLIEAIPAEEWVVSAKDEHNLKIADKLNLEGNVLLSRVEGSSKNYFFERPEVVSRLKKEVVNILECAK